MRRTLLFVTLLLTLLALPVARPLAQPDEVFVSCKVVQEENIDYRGLLYFALDCGNKEQRTAITVDERLPLAEWLARHNNEQVTLELRVRELQRIIR